MFLSLNSSVIASKNAYTIYNKPCMKDISLKLFQDSELLTLLFLSAAILLILWFLFKKIPDIRQKDVHKTSSLPFVKPSYDKPVYTKLDFFVIIAACLIYGVVSFTRLGSTVFPTTTWQPDMSESNQSFILELPEGTAFDQVSLIYGEGDTDSNPNNYQIGADGITITGSNDLLSWYAIGTIENSYVYKYSTIPTNADYRYIKVTAASKDQTITEIAFKAAGEERLLPVQVYEDGYADSKYPAELTIDEQDKVVLHPTYYDEGFFDEIYHPRNAWEIANGQTMYATVHPLLGTNIMALFIKLFGMSPFVWRLPGALFGIMIIPMFYMILKLMFKDTRLCTLGTVLVAADFMHITTSRIGTLEPFSVFFILLMFYWMIRYFFTNFYDTDSKTTLRYLLFSGISMGVAIATKWTACYSAVGLALILFANWYQRFKEYKLAKKALQSGDLNHEQKLEAKHIVSNFMPMLKKTFLLCFVFFIFIPVVIYWVSYIPDKVWGAAGWSISNVWDQNMYMYNYHTDLTSTHPFSSTWYMWLFDIRPIWYYSNINQTGISNTISCFSNPLLTWVGVPAVLYMIYDMFKHKSRKGFVILVGILTALGPWVLLVSRCVFAYHFYPTSFFMMLAIVYCAKRLLEKDEKLGMKIITVYMILYVVMFIVFLPAITGFGTTQAYIKALEWLPTWYFG